MRSRRPSPEHQEAVSRRLALLSAELAAARDAPEPLLAAAVPDDDWWSEHTRVAAPRRPLVAVPDPDQSPAPTHVPSHVPSPVPSPVPDVAVPVPVPAPVVPVPGRHAARRRISLGRVLTGLVPEPLRGPAGLGPAHLSVVAVLVAIGLAVTCWWVVRGDAEPARGGESLALTAPATAPASPAALETPAPAPSAGAVAAGSVTVDVAGEVRRPGIAVLDAGSRVVDAIEAAGGARRGVDLSSLNLARVLVDGEQVLVGETAGAPPAAAAVPGATAPAAGALTDLNTATVAELELLPEVGPVTAQAIVTWRDAHGGFTAVEELLEVDGIGDKTLATIAPHVTV